MEKRNRRFGVVAVLASATALVAVAVNPANARPMPSGECTIQAPDGSCTTGEVPVRAVAKTLQVHVDGLTGSGGVWEVRDVKTNGLMASGRFDKGDNPVRTVNIGPLFFGPYFLKCWSDAAKCKITGS